MKKRTRVEPKVQLKQLMLAGRWDEANEFKREYGRKPKKNLKNFGGSYAVENASASRTQ